MNKLQELREIEMLDSSPLPKIIPSRLNHLEPIGIGTPYVESITSYTVRLAHTHTTLPIWLVKHEVFPNFPVDMSLFNSSQIWVNSNTLNTNGEWAYEWAMTLQKLTKRNDLIYLTLSPFSEVFPQMKLVKQNLAWCPACYNEWRKEENIIYNPLLWHFSEVHICAKHKLPLRLHCLFCKKEQKVMSTEMCNGYCQHCGEWLGETTGIKEKVISLEWQISISDQMGDLLAKMPTLSEKPVPQDTTKKHFAELPRITNGNKTVLAKEFSVSNRALNAWIKGDSLPQLGNLLKICCRLDISVFDWLVKADLELESAISKHNTIPLPDKKINRRPSNTGQIGRLLLAVGMSTIEPPMTISELAEILDYPPPYLGQNYPEACELIKSNNQNNKIRQADMRLANLRLKIRKAVFDLNNEGTYPTQWQVQKKIEKPALFKSPDARQFYKEALVELESHNIN